MAEKRFVTVEQQGNGFTDLFQEVCDLETGVHYLCWKNGYAGGITPLLGADGRPMVTARGTVRE